MKAIIQQGAEATIYQENNTIIKERLPKTYRLPVLDEKLRKSRTKAEAKILAKLKEIINVPAVMKSDDHHHISMEHIEGKKLADHLESLDWKIIAQELGNTIAKIHDHDIIHGDLTTSNMILANEKLYLIDFGLGFHSRKIEDKAVDLHLLKQALEAKHHRIADECFSTVLKYYTPKQAELIKKRIETIEKRGRYKDKY